MDAIENMITRMNEQAISEREALKKERLAEIDMAFIQEQTHINNEHEALLQKQIKEIEKKYKQQRDRQQVTFRQAALHEKQRVLTKFFKDAVDEMNHWPKEDMQKFSEHLLEKIELATPLTIQVGELSRDGLTAEWVEEMNHLYNKQMTLLDELLPKQAGFILHDNGIQYNFVFENLVKELQTHMGVELAKRLFD
ncbi:ATPase V [Vagococcus xieshaowenii]|uniref:ATPase V n=1 Tax=Vagococcus xieshaowenii TaxID=2562451 RepID=A0AAJ5EE69_9ENTE|nr:ATPase V [Vagococcus xieshaowenii]QCA29019.1 ATPase V [Vagococcus xieshaowenii]TFZ41005.1 ATPase V [Vagococcus xieshaowenii]